MSLSKDNLLSAADFIGLKARVKAEMLRRNGSGDLSAYGGTVWDYTIPPVADEVVSMELFNKLIQPQQAITTTGVAILVANNDTSLHDMTIIDAKQTLFEAQARGATSGNDCAALCSGMCIATCSTACIGGCTGQCTTTCWGGCKGSSTCGGCTGCTGCGGACSGPCNSSH